MNKHTEGNTLQQNEYWDLITSKLSSYEVKKILSDGKVKTYKINDDYFVSNNTWYLDIVGQIPNFTEQYKKRRLTGGKITFSDKNLPVSLELKFIYFCKLFNEEWSLSTIFYSNCGFMNRLNQFLNDRYPKLPSLLALDIDKAEKQWMWWLSNKGIPTKQKSSTFAGNDIILTENKSSIASFLRIIYDYLSKQTDTRNEWEKDRWDLRILNEKYGIEYNPSETQYYLNFNRIKNDQIKVYFKRYIKTRLLSAQHFSGSTAKSYLHRAPIFFNFLCDLEPNWNDLKNLTREHIEKYLEYLNYYSKNHLKNKNAVPKYFINKNIGCIRTVLDDFQKYEYSIAPKIPITRLIFSGDYPRLPKKMHEDINHVPDFVLAQLFEHLNDLHPDIQPIVWIMYKTGLRVSDALGVDAGLFIPFKWEKLY